MPTVLRVYSDSGHAKYSGYILIVVMPTVLQVYSDSGHAYSTPGIFW